MDESLSNALLMGDGGAPASKQMSKSQKKKAQKKQKKKEEQKEREVAFEIEEVTEEVMKVSLADEESDKPTKGDTKQPVTSRKKKASSLQGNPPSSTGQEISGGTASPDSDRETLKQVRALRKKLKQIAELERKVASGEIANPEPEQLTKLARKEELTRQLEELTASS